MIKNYIALLAVIGVAVILVPLAVGFAAPTELGPTAAGYVDSIPEDLGAANLVTGIVVAYRGFDTLGEVSVLFLAATGVGFVMKTKKRETSVDDVAVNDTAAGDTAENAGDTAENAGDRATVDTRLRRPPSEILETGAAVLTPLLLLFGAYIFVHGHLTPGGGFQGGVVIASALVLSVLGSSTPMISHAALGAIESLSGAFYVAVGAAGLVWAGGFLDATILPAGTLGRILSAGAIPIIYVLIGLKVGTELTSIVERLRVRGEET